MIEDGETEKKAFFMIEKPPDMEGWLKFFFLPSLHKPSRILNIGSTEIS